MMFCSVFTGRSRPRSLKERKCSSPLVMKWCVLHNDLLIDNHAYGLICENWVINNIHSYIVWFNLLLHCISFAGWVRTMRQSLALVCPVVYSTHTIKTSAKETRWNHHQPLALGRWAEIHQNELLMNGEYFWNQNLSDVLQVLTCVSDWNIHN